MGDISFTISWRDQNYSINLPGDSTVGHLANILQKLLPDIDMNTAKLLSGGRALKVVENQKATLFAVGIRSGARLKLMASSQAGVQAVRGAREPPAMPSFEHEEKRERARQAAGSPNQFSSSDLKFQSFEAWQRPGLNPPPSEALKLLHQLASDAGILGIMKKYGWNVGLLSEMPPAGKVGVSPVCILGVNINQGQEISMRLRTDDLKGFRKYDAIRQTLIHELAHMVYSEHDNSFKELNSQLKREVQALDWRNAPGGKTAGVPGAGGAPTLSLGKEPAAPSSRLGGRIGGEAVPVANARSAAAAAALRRAGVPQSFPIDLIALPPGSSIIGTPEEASATTTISGAGTGALRQPTEEFEQPPKKGDIVLYRQRDGSWVQVKIASVDVSVLPPSYGIEVPAEDGGETNYNYRETELSRLRPLPKTQAAVGESNGGIDGYTAHYDPQTEAKEIEVQRRFE